MAIRLLSIFALLFFFACNHSARENIKEEQDHDYSFAQRAFPFGTIDYNAHAAAAVLFKSGSNDLLRSSGAMWQFAGPVNTGGRITDIEMHPSDKDIAYLAAASGGVFKTINRGGNWFPVFDNIPALSIGDIALAPSNPDVLYVGTGEANGGSGSLTYNGNGVYKSIDGGNTWQHAGLDSCRMIGRIAVHPANPDIAFVASMGEMYANTPSRGLYRTDNGGLTWSQVLYVNDSVGAVDVVINPVNPNLVFAATWERTRRVNDKFYSGVGSGLWKSTDGGLTFARITNGLPPVGLPYSRVGVDLCITQPNILYAVYIADSYDFLGLFKSTDDGDTWQQTQDSDLQGTMGSQGYWWGRVKVDPVNPDVVYVLNFDVHKSTNGGNGFSIIASGHVDQHAVAVHPADNQLVWMGNDGGLYLSNDGGLTSVHHQDLPITQFYRCAIDYLQPQRLYGGTQDNGTYRTMTGQLNDWDHIYGGDGFFCLVDPQDNRYVYAEYQYGNIAKSVDTGYNFSSAVNGLNGFFNWNTPVVFDPSDPSILYTGSQQVYKTTDRADTWNSISPDLTTLNTSGSLRYGTITAIEVSPVNSDILYAGTDDGKVWRTLDAGLNWMNVSGGLPLRWVTSIACDPFDAQSAYVTFSGYRFNDNIGHVYKTSDHGVSWSSISGNLPDIPCNKILADPSVAGWLYLATDVGVFYSNNNGTSWQQLGSGMPVLVCNDLALHAPTHKLVVGTYGRGLWTFDLGLITNYSNPELLTLNAVVFPNPTAGMLHISVPGYYQSFSLKVFDANGKLVISRSANTINATIETNLPTGSYFIEIKTSNARHVSKILVDRIE